MRQSDGRYHRIALLFLLTAICLIFYGKLITYDFLGWDDPIHVYNNALLLDPSLKNLMRIWTESQNELYIPFTYTVWFAVAYVQKLISLFGAPNQSFSLDAAPFHALNLLFHILNVLLVFTLLRKFLQTLIEARIQSQADQKKKSIPGHRDEGESRAISQNTALDLSAATGALLFAIHPIQIESVAWITAFKDLLMTSTSLLVLHAYWTRRYKFATFLYCIALLSKPSAMILPLLVFGINSVRTDSKTASDQRWPALWIIAAIPIAIITKTVQLTEILKFVPPIFKRPLIVGDTLTFYLQQIFFQKFCFSITAGLLSGFYPVLGLILRA